MPDVTLSYKGSDILELSDSGSATLKTGGKYCEDDIAVEYVKPSGGGSLGDFTLISTLTVQQGVSAISISLPSGYTEYAVHYDVTNSASVKRNVYHTSVAASRLLGQSNTGVSWDAIAIYTQKGGDSIDGIATLKRVAAFGVTALYSSYIIYYEMPETLYLTPQTSGVTFESGTIKVFGR